jgi:hypothetical protein
MKIWFLILWKFYSIRYATNIIHHWFKTLKCYPWYLIEKCRQKGFVFVWPLKEILKDLKIEVLVLFSSYNYGAPSFWLNYVGEKWITCAMHIEQKYYAIGIILRRIKHPHNTTQPKQKHQYCIYVCTCGKNANVDSHRNHQPKD